MNRFITTVCVLLALAASLPGLSGCARRQPPSNEPTIEKHVYTVRGQVIALPSADAPAAEFQVRHEAIPHFRASATELGMDTMAMPFPLAEGLSLVGVKVGDKVTVTFEVDFDSDAGRPAGYRATKVEPLPPETELDWTPLPRD